jgi:predicted RNase H-like HicB family nuclease
MYWNEGDTWLGYLVDFPDYWTQGSTIDDLLDHLRDLYTDLSDGKIPSARRVGEMTIS